MMVEAETDTDSDKRDDGASETDEDRMRKIELICDRIGVSREEARASLELSDFDALDAVILLERQGRTAPRTAHASTAVPGGEGLERPCAADQMTQAQIDYENDTRRGGIEDRLTALIRRIRQILQRSIDISVVVQRRGRRLISMPTLLAILLLFASVWCSVFWILAVLMIISLFFGVRYRLEGAGRAAADPSVLPRRATEATGIAGRRIQDDAPGSR